MRIVVVLVAFLIWSSKLFSQDLAGEWKGSFTDDSRKYSTGEKIKIFFYFSKIDDSTFRAFSKTYITSEGKTDSSICIMEGGFLKKNILYLEEKKAIRSFATADTNLCFQLMKLYFIKRKNKLLLEGDWYTENENCGFGSIRLTKSY